MTERLTKRHPNGVVGISKCRYYNFDDFQKMAKKLADYEDIGTVSEFRELQEKATAKKQNDKFEFSPCPRCGSRETLGDGFCYVCGTILD